MSSSSSDHMIPEAPVVDLVREVRTMGILLGSEHPLRVALEGVESLLSDQEPTQPLPDLAAKEAMEHHTPAAKSKRKPSRKAGKKAS